MKYEKPVVRQNVYVAGPSYFNDGFYKVAKVGRMYFYTGPGYRPHPHNLSDWRGSGNHMVGDYQAYPTKEHYDDKLEHAELVNEIRNSLGGYGSKDWLSLKSLREIKRIIEGEEETA